MIIKINLKTIRDLALAACVVVPPAVFGGMWLYGGKALKSTDEVLPGDDLLPADDPKYRLQQEIEIDAPRETVWEVLAQLGQRQGGFYAPAWLERACTFEIYNTYDKVDEWQEKKPGEFMFYHQAGIGSQIMDVNPGEYFTSLSDTRRPPTARGGFALLPPFGIKNFAWTWNFVLQDLPDGRTRFVNRCDCTFEPFDSLLGKFGTLVLLGGPSVYMVRRMLQKVKQVAEGKEPDKRPDRVVRRFGVQHPDAKPIRLGLKRQ